MNQNCGTAELTRATAVPAAAATAARVAGPVQAGGWQAGGGPGVVAEPGAVTRRPLDAFPAGLLPEIGRAHV